MIGLHALDVVTYSASPAAPGPDRPRHRGSGAPPTVAAGPDPPAARRSRPRSGRRQADRPEPPPPLATGPAARVGPPRAHRPSQTLTSAGTTRLRAAPAAGRRCPLRAGT